jgi:branched-chain amino acid transport system permease protein
MQFWTTQVLNSLALGGLLLLLASGFSLIFGLMRLANLSHGALFMIGAYVAAATARSGWSFAAATAAAAAVTAVLGVLLERLLLRRLLGNPQGQVLATLGIAFIAADACLVIWGGDPIPAQAPSWLLGSVEWLGTRFPAYRLAVIAAALGCAAALYWLLERTRLGARIRAGVDDMAMARAVGIRASVLFTTVFCLGALLAGFGGALGAPMLSAYPGLDGDMLPLALIVVILGGIGSLAGTYLASFIIGFIYTFGIALLPDLAYVILFLPMILVLAFRPAGLLGGARA